MNEVNNYILLYGQPVDYPQQVSVDKQGRAYYKFNLSVARDSGIIDILPIVVEEETEAFDTLADIDEKGNIEDSKLIIKGEVRTRNLKSEDGGKLDISVRAFEIEADSNYCGVTNRVIITGHVCKEITNRVTPRGITIADITLAVNREDGSRASDYIPSIMWNGTAKRAKERLAIGDCIEGVGRLQSREYTKELANGEKEPRTCYELSVNSYELLKKNEVSA